jgi:hypothetical protein
VGWTLSCVKPGVAHTFDVTTAALLGLEQQQHIYRGMHFIGPRTGMFNSQDALAG